MASYRVETFDVCASGFERLRNQNEFILLAYVDGETTAESYLEQWLSDIDSCMRPESFDYDAARETVRNYHAESVAPLFANNPNPFRLETPAEEEEGESAVAFLYISDAENLFPVWS